MLYERWLKIVQECGDAIALQEIGKGRAWTFCQLAEEAALMPTLGEPIAFPQGNDSGFIFTVLRAWRDGIPVCPLEPGQSRLELTTLPVDISHLKTTSGTSGAARFAVFTAAQLAADVDNIVTTMELRQDSPNLGVISLAHSYGYSNLVLPLLLHGIPLTLCPSALPEMLRTAATTGSNWTLPAVPALWRAWSDADAIPTDLRLAISAGAPLPIKLEHSVFAECGFKIHNFLGSSECGGIAFDRTSTPRTDATLAGEPLNNVSVDLSPDGCLTVCGPAVGTSYWPEPDNALREGRFVTADLAELRDGCVILRGRASDIINVAGRKVSPEVIERALLEHASVRECLVVGLPGRDAIRGEQIAAVVALQRDTAAEQLRQFLCARLPEWQVPRQWRFVDAIKMNDRGKASRAEWARLWSID